MTKDATSLTDTEPLSQRFDPEVRRYLQLRCRNVGAWLRDAHNLVAEFKGNHAYYDYSFVVTPAFKALEEWLLIIAPALGVPETMISGARHSGNLGSFLKDDQIGKFIESTIKKLDLEAKQKKRLRASVQSLNSYLRDFRHTPAHCSNTIDNGLQAETVVHQITGALNDLTRNLLESGALNGDSQSAKPQV